MVFPGKVTVEAIVLLVKLKFVVASRAVITLALRGGWTQGIRLVVAVGKHHQPQSLGRSRLIKWLGHRWNSRDYTRDLSPIFDGTSPNMKGILAIYMYIYICYPPVRKHGRPGSFLNKTGIWIRKTSVNLVIFHCHVWFPKCKPTNLWKIMHHMVVSIVMGIPQNGWFIVENPLKMGWFGGTSISGNHHMEITEHRVK